MIVGWNPTQGTILVRRTSLTIAQSDRATMRIELKEPFRSVWKKGYLRTGADLRKRVDLFNSNNDRTTISYARYLLSTKLGRFLTEDEHVDHKDNDKSNDDISNLQILTSEQNRLKEQIRYIEEDQVCYGHYCAYCEVSFILTERERKMKLKAGTIYAFCSRSCAMKFNIEQENSPLSKSIPKEKINEINKLANLGCSIYEIRKRTGLSWATIKKYMKT